MYITDKQKDHLTPRYSHPPQIDELPKVHQDSITLCPIVLSIGSPIYQLAKELICILSPLTLNTDSFVRNSKDFLNTVKGLEINKADVLASFDVVSLYTKVPIDEAVEIIAS